MPSFAYASHLSPQPAPPRPAPTASPYASHMAPSRPTTPAPMRGVGAKYATHLSGNQPAPPRPNAGAYASHLPKGPNPFEGMY